MEWSTEHHPLHPVNPVFRALLWLSIVGISWAQREVTVQEGPLYRTVGTHITIWCKVTGYKQPSEQNFQYSIYLPSAPDREVMIVSTQDPSISYAIYSRRVRSGDIYIERVTGDHTILHIRQLQERDAGEYECHTPNTDTAFFGSYSAKVNLHVLADTLLVTMPQQELEKMERSSLEVTCDVSKNSSRHTHLSVSWFLSSEKDVAILSLSRDFVLLPGESFAERFTSGDIRMDKLSDSSYRLSIKELQLSDQGDLFCQGSEWIQDPDGTWTNIIQKKSEKTTLKVSALQGKDFKVQVESTDTRVKLKSPLEITCFISRDSLIDSRFSVTWLLDGAIIATWDASGVSSFGTKYRTREAKGQMFIRRRDQNTWTLRLSQVNEQDGGSYLCDATEEGSQRKRQSTPVDVFIETPGTPVRSVRIHSEASELYEGDSVILFCQVSGSSAFIDVTWLTMRPSGQWVEVATLSRDGEVKMDGEYVQRHKTGHLTAQRLNNGLHSLTLVGVVEGDGGAYRCLLTDWIQQPDDEWRNETYNSNPLQINVRLLSSALEVVLMSRRQQVTSGSSLSLFCTVTTEYSLQDKRLSWSWDYQPTSGSFRNLVNVSGDGSLSWGDSNLGFQGEVQLSITGRTNTLTIYRVQRQYHQGAYRCRVQVLTRDAGAPHASVSSISMNVQVVLPDARLTVDAADQDVLVTSGQDEAAVYCNIRATTPGAVLHVGWFLLSPASPSAVNILNVTHQGLISHHPSFSRFLSERLSPNQIVLRILRPRLLESFSCAVRELLQESGEWVTLVERSSGVTKLTLSVSDQTLKIPKENVSYEVPAGGDVALPCPLGQGQSSSALYSVSWYYQGAKVSNPSLLYRAGWDGVTEYKEVLAGRLQMVAAVWGNYSLILRSVGEEDAGKYHCQVEEWRLREDSWRLEALDTSGYLQLRVTAPDNRLSVNRTELTLITPERSSLVLPCHVLCTSAVNTVFSITWWKVQAPDHQLLFNASRLGQFVYPSEEGRRLQYERTSELTFLLRIHHTHVTDAGIYYCKVQEWVQTPRGVWYQTGEQSGGNMSVIILATGSHSHICSTPGFFYFLLVILVLFFILLMILGWRLLTRWKNKQRNSSLKNEKNLWSSVKKSEMKVFTRRVNSEADEAEQIQL
ncbi:hypothetical protein PRIEUP_LOCUS12017, partial [Pristimantis euphronides]